MYIKYMCIFCYVFWYILCNMIVWKIVVLFSLVICSVVLENFVFNVSGDENNSYLILIIKVL